MQEVRGCENVSAFIRSLGVFRWAPAVAFAALALAALTAGIAHGDNRTSATAILDELANDAVHKAAIGAIVQRGRDALERATRMRAAGDEAHAQLADGLALEEAETARDLVRALEVERMADDARRGTTDAGAVGERERALLEEGIARNGRLKAEIEDFEQIAPGPEQDGQERRRGEERRRRPEERRGGPVRRAGAAVVVSALMLSCATTQIAIPRLAEVERVRETPAAKEASELAPQAYAHAEAERTEARKADERGDQVAALLYADRAVAAYGHAFALARLARATKDNDATQAALATAVEETRKLAESRQQVEKEGNALDTELAAIREAQPPVPSGPADAKRELARLVAARSLVAEALLLCGAARLVAPDSSTLADVEKQASDLDAQIDAKPHPAPIDAAARARAKCLEQLTTARRTSAGTTGGDELLAEISASGGLDPSRDERGVVVSLRDVFEGTKIAKKAEAKIAELGRIAAAHPDSAVQVVVHDANAPSKAEAAADAERADAVVKGLVAAGAKAERVKGATAGAKAPIVDPGDAAHRGMNGRVDVVFVTK